MNFLKELFKYIIKRKKFFLIPALFIYFAGGVELRVLMTVLILFPFMLLFTWVGSIMFRVLDNGLFNKLILYFLTIFGVYIIASTSYKGFFSI